MRGQEVFGGYLITRPLRRPAWLRAPHLPERIVTASGCLTEFVPDLWIFPWSGVGDDERERSRGAFGVAAEHVPDLARVAEQRMAERRLLWCRYLQDDDAVREILPFVRADDLVVLGLALDEALVPLFVDEHGGGARDGETLLGALARGAPVPAGGEALGLEPLGFEHDLGGAHSWLCNRLDEDLELRHGARPGRNGLLEDAALAERWCAEMTRDELGEPVLWLPWRLFDFRARFAAR